MTVDVAMHRANRKIQRQSHLSNHNKPTLSGFSNSTFNKLIFYRKNKTSKQSKRLNYPSHLSSPLPVTGSRSRKAYYDQHLTSANIELVFCQETNVLTFDFGID